MSKIFILLFILVSFLHSENNNNKVIKKKALTIGQIKTGQVKSYKTYDDGYYQKGAIRSYTRLNGIVTDNTTRLMWQDNEPYTLQEEKAYNDDINFKKVKSWEYSKKYCKGLSLGGHTNWRLPTRLELLSIVDNGRHSPAISSKFKNIALGYYWSSSSCVPCKGDAWYIDFIFGYTNYHSKSDSNYVRCVRNNNKDN